MQPADAGLDPPIPARWKRLAGWATIRLIVLLLLGTLLLLLFHGPAALLVDSLAGSAAEQSERSLAKSRTARRGPPILWLHYDDASQLTSALTGSPFVSRMAIARALDVIRTSPEKPLLIYIDVAIALPSGDPTGEAALRSALQRWAAGGGALPPIGIHAGPACLPPVPAESGAAASQVTPLDPGAYASVVSLPGAIGASRLRIIWSCPMYADMIQDEWSCVEMRDGIGTDRLTALPSPAWFARAVADSHSAASPKMLADLRYADGICGMADLGEGRGFPLPHSRVLFDVPWAMGGDKVDGRPIQRELSLAAFAEPGSDHSGLRRAIVVIGGGTSLIPDLHRTSQGLLPGAMLVAGSMRDAWMYGLPKKRPPWLDALGAAGTFLALVLLIHGVLPSLQRKLLQAVSGWAKPILFVVTHEQVWLGLVLGWALTSSRFLLYDFTLSTVFAVMMTEALLLMHAMEKEWHDQNPAH